MKHDCPYCGTFLDRQGACPTCGFVTQPTASHWPTQHSPYHPYYRTPGQPDFALAITALLVNILFVPGVGSLIARQWFAGTFQFLIYAGSTIGFVVALVLGASDGTYFPISLGLAGAWLWSLLTGIRLVRDSNR